MSTNGKHHLRIIVAAVTLLGVTIACSCAPEAADELGITIDRPQNGITVTVGEEVVVESTITAPAGAVSVDLMANGNVVRHDEPPADDPTSFRLAQSWIPMAAGQVTLSVTVYDSEDASAVDAINLQVTASSAGGLPPQPTDPTVSTEEGCTYDADFVADVTIPDHTALAQGDAFIKTWLIRNSGNCAYEDGFELIFGSGDRMGGPASVPVPAVAAGSETELSVNLVAPMTYGTFRGTWTLRSHEGDVFGTHLTVVIDVPAPATETPTPPPPVAPAPYTQNVSTQFTIQAGESTMGEAECPAGSIAVGGGFIGNTDLIIMGHFQHTDSWLVYAKNTWSSSREGRAHAVCLFNAPAGTTTTREYQGFTVAPKGFSDPSVSCPSGSVVTGGGWLVEGGGLLPKDEDIHVYNSRPTTNGWELRAYNRSEDESVQITVYAVCLSSSGANVVQASDSVSVPGMYGEGEASATCPAGTMVTGGGFSTDAPFDTTMSFNASDQQWNVVGVNLHGQYKTLTSYALCLTLP